MSFISPMVRQQTNWRRIAATGVFRQQGQINGLIQSRRLLFYSTAISILTPRSTVTRRIFSSINSPIHVVARIWPIHGVMIWLQNCFECRCKGVFRTTEDDDLSTWVKVNWLAVSSLNEAQHCTIIRKNVYFGLINVYKSTILHAL